MLRLISGHYQHVSYFLSWNSNDSVISLYTAKSNRNFVGGDTYINAIKQIIKVILQL